MDQSKQMDVMFKSSRTDEIDPISGNEVPTGSLPEEVRDDIPAQLSEGEYVVPADVVRYYGVKHFEDMRTEAKQGFQQLDSNGRIGGEPVGMEMGGDDLPFDISELQIVDDGQPEQPMMNKGGYISGYAEGGSAITTTGGVTYVMYVNAEGATMQIPFFNGVPMSVIPEGFFVQGEAPETEAAPIQSSGDDDDGGLTTPESINYKKLTAEELSKMVEEQNGNTAQLISGGIGLVNPLFGLLSKFAFSDMARRTENEIKRRIDSGEYTDNKGFYENLLEESAEKKPGFLKGIFDKLTGKDEESTGAPTQEEIDSAVSLAISRSPGNPVPTAMSDLEAREWRTKLGYKPEASPEAPSFDLENISDSINGTDLFTSPVQRSDVVKPGELDLSEITTTELEPSVTPDPYVGKVSTPTVSDPRFDNVATPGLDDTPRGSDSGYLPSSSDSDSDSDSGPTLLDQMMAGARKSRENTEDYSKAQYGGKLITDADGSTRAVPTYNTEAVRKTKINPGGR